MLTLPAVGLLYKALESEAAEYPWLSQSPFYAPLLSTVHNAQACVRILAEAITDGRVAPVVIDLLLRKPLLADSIGTVAVDFDVRVIKRWSADVSAKRAEWEMLLEAYRDHMPLHPRFTGVSAIFTAKVEDSMRALESTNVCDWTSPATAAAAEAAPGGGAAAVSSKGIRELATKLRKASESFIYTELWEAICQADDSEVGGCVPVVYSTRS